MTNLNVNNGQTEGILVPKMRDDAASTRSKKSAVKLANNSVAGVNSKYADEGGAKNVQSANFTRASDRKSMAVITGVEVDSEGVDCPGAKMIHRPGKKF